MPHPALTYAFLFTLTMEKAAKKRDLVHLSRNGKRRKVSRTTYNLWPDHKYGYEEVREEGREELPTAVKKNLEKVEGKGKGSPKNAPVATPPPPAIPLAAPQGDVNKD